MKVKMLPYILLLTTLAPITFAEVLSSTRYSDAASAVDYSLRDGGYSSSSFQVCIADVGEGMTYFIAWLDDYYSGSDSDLGKLISALGAVAGVSSSTSWTSTYVCVGFDNRMFTAETEDTRWLMRNIATMTADDFVAWMITNLYIEDY